MWNKNPFFHYIFWKSLLVRINICQMEHNLENLFRRKTWRIEEWVGRTLAQPVVSAHNFLSEKMNHQVNLFSGILPVVSVKFTQLFALQQCIFGRRNGFYAPSTPPNRSPIFLEYLLLVFPIKGFLQSLESLYTTKSNNNFTFYLQPFHQPDQT